jgi:tripartite-type tricarboxylate transporter receptor subunit TctC
MISVQSKSRADIVMKLPHRRQILHLAAGAAALPAVRFAWAQAYPTRPVRFIVPIAAGGGLDFVARVIGNYLSRSMGQQFIVENKVGAGGMLGVEAAAKGAPDGYTILVTTNIVASAPAIVSFNVGYIKGLVPVIELIRTPQVMAVHPSLAVNSVAELILAAQRRPGMGYASAGIGSHQHFIGEWFAKITGIKLEHVPYRGAGQAINDLIAGHVRIGVLGPTAVIPHHKAGTLRILAQSTERRSESLPDVPTLQEAGVKGLVLEAWQGVFVPAGTPPAIVARPNTEIGKALADGAIREKLLEAAQEPVGGSPEQLARVFHEDSEKFARLAKELNIKAE